MIFKVTAATGVFAAISTGSNDEGGPCAVAVNSFCVSAPDSGDAGTDTADGDNGISA